MSKLQYPFIFTHTTAAGIETYVAVKGGEEGKATVVCLDEGTHLGTEYKNVLYEEDVEAHIDAGTYTIVNNTLRQDLTLPKFPIMFRYSSEQIYIAVGMNSTMNLLIVAIDREGKAAVYNNNIRLHVLENSLKSGEASIIESVPFEEPKYELVKNNGKILDASKLHLNIDIDTTKLDVALEKAKELEATILRIKELLA